MQEFFQQIALSFGDYRITFGQLLLTGSLLALLLLFQFLVLQRWLPLFFERQEVENQYQKKIKRTAVICFGLLAALVLLLGLDLNMDLYAPEPTDESAEPITFRLSGVIGILLAWQLARLTDMLLSKMLARRYTRGGKMESPGQVFLPSQKQTYHNRTVQYVVYLIALAILIVAFGLNLSITIPVGQNPLSPSLTDFITAIIILLVARLFIWSLVQFALTPYYRRKDINIGSQYAINQLIKYVLYTIALLIALQTLGIQMTLIWGGAAALLVGVGLGLQQTFNDFFSGLVLLFERSVEVGDVVDIGGLVGTVRRIGLRASHIQTRDNITVIVPNSKLVVDNVVNWSHSDNRARFHVSVGVAYGSDTELVKQLLIECAQANEKTLNFPRPFVRFVDFGNSSLDFEIHFWTNEFIRIEDVKSDLRFAIDQAFRDNQVTIPFPQRDLWFKNPIHQENGIAPREESPPQEEKKREG